MPDNRSAAIDAAIDAVIDAAAARWKGWQPGQPLPRKLLSPTEVAASVGFLGTKPEHVGDFHDAAAVLGGGRPHALVSPDFFAAHPAGRRLQARLLATGHVVKLAYGGVVVAKPTATKYARDPGKPSKFSSTYVLLDGPARDRVLALGRQIPDSDLADDGREDEPHVTVRYGLHTDAAAPVERLLGRVRRPVRYRLGRVSVFRGGETGKDYDVVKVDVESDDLRRLNRLLKSLPNTETWPDYKPHATIAYVKAGLGDDYARRFGSVGVDAEADAVVFSNRDRQKTVIGIGDGRRQSATKYDREPTAADRPPHPLVAGFRIEHALRHLTTDPAASGSTRQLASAVLHDGDTAALAGLNDSLQKDGHPLHRQYNWLAASHKIHTDAAVAEAVAAVARRSGHSPFGHSPEQQAVAALDALHNGRPQPPSPLTTAAADALAALHGSGLGRDDVGPSLQRHRLRLSDAWLAANQPELAAAVPAKALDPERVLAESVAAPGVGASRYGRVRRPVHELVRGTRLSHVLRELAKDADATVAKFAKAALATGDGTHLGVLHDRLEEIDHPTLGLGYNFRAAGRGLQVDAAAKKFLLKRARTLLQTHPDRFASVSDAYRHAVESRGYHAYTYGVAADNDLRRHLADRLGGVSGGEVAKSLARLHQRNEDRTERRAAAADPASDHQAGRALWEAERVRKKALSPLAEAKEPVGSGLFSNIPARRNFGEEAARFDRRGTAGADFLSALRRLRSREQQTRRRLAESIAEKLKLTPAVVRDALSDHPRASVAAVAQSLSHGDEERVRAGAAWLGLHLQLPSLLVFRHGDGPDRLHRVDVGGSGEKVRADLDRHGVDQRVLLPRGDGWRVLVYDAGSGLESKVAAFAAAVGSRLRTATGTGEVVGDSADATADGRSRSSYRSLIRKFEQRQRPQQPPLPQPQPGVVNAGVRF